MERKKRNFKKELERVVGEYLLRMFLEYRTNKVEAKDELIDCPCGTKRALECEDGFWHNSCGCGFLFPQEFTPPDPQEIKEYFQKIFRDRQIKQMIVRTRPDLGTLIKGVP